MPQSLGPTTRAAAATQERLTRMIIGGRSFSGRERNCLFLNVPTNPAGRRRFANISAVSGFGIPDDARALATCDWDHDGDVDVWISNRNAPRLRFLRNNTDKEHDFLLLELVGTGPSTSRDALGARVEITVQATSSDALPQAAQTGVAAGDATHGFDSATQIKTVRAGDGFLSQSSTWLHFGLGRSARVQRVRVMWPGGTQEDFKGCGSNGRYRLTQGTGQAVAVPRRSSVLAIEPREIEIPATSSVARIPLTYRVPMPSFEYLSRDRQRVRTDFGRGRPTLLTLWSKSCHPCLSELQELSRAEGDVQAAGLDILALSIDAVQQGDHRPSDTVRLMSQLGFPFSFGEATRASLEILQTVQDFLVSADRPLTLPVSFLVDEHGEVAVIYKGRHSVTQLLSDVRAQPGTRFSQCELTALLPGRCLEHPRIEASMRRAEVARRYRWAGVVESMTSPSEMLIHYRRLIQIQPDFAAAHNDLGVAQTRLGQSEAAAVHFKKAIQLEPNYLDAFKNLAAVRIQQGDLVAAESLLNRTLEIDAGYASAVAELGMVRWIQGRKEAAARFFRRATEMDPELDRSYYCLGVVFADRQDWPQATKYLQKCLELNPANLDARRALAQVRRLQQ